MNNRLLDLLQTKNLSAVRFAEIMEVQASSISHILSGRNKPSFDFIAKLINSFPDVNVEWFISGIGSMLKEDVNPSSTIEELSLFVEQQKSVPEATVNTNKPTYENLETPNNLSRAPKIISENSVKDLPILVDCNDQIEKIIIFYTDKTFSVFNKR